jgi:anti-sigma regulatory factor (Ser/Thr protein kinase)
VRVAGGTSSVSGIKSGRRFEPAALNVRAAREFVAGALEAARFTGDVDTVLLLVSELVTNAVRHAATPFEITVEIEGDSVRVDVIDEDVAHLPRVRNPSPEDTNGRGLLIVDELADGWGSDEVGTGNKAVWFTFS